MAYVPENEYVTSQNRINPTRSRRRLIRNIVIAAVGLTICGAVIFIGGLVLLANALKGMDGFLNYPQCTISNPKGVEEVAQFKLPPSAKLLKAGCGGMQGWA